MVNVTIVGTGDHAYGLSHLYNINNGVEEEVDEEAECGGSKNNGKNENNRLVVTKPGLQSHGLFHDTGVEYANFDESLDSADIVILAIPSYAIKKFIKTYRARLSNKILVDCTNSTKKSGDDLYSVLSMLSSSSRSSSRSSKTKKKSKKKYNFKWVKGLNDFGAVDVLLKKPNSKVKLPTKMCGPDDDALEMVKAFAEKSLGCVVKKIPFEHYLVVAKHQNSIGKEWVKSAWIMVIIFIITQIYNIIR